MDKKLRGCRPSNTVIQDLSNIFAEYGAAKHRHQFTLPKEIERLETRVNELRLELDEARRQEMTQKPEESAPVLEAVQ